MRPLGPEPATAERSTPFPAAIRLASGLALTRSPSDLCVGASAFGASAFGAGLSSAGLASGSLAAGAAASFGASTAPASSPSSASSAIGVPTFTPSVPSATRILAITPSSTASNSIVALSVSISAMMSPDLTVSPSFTSHLASVPSSIVGDSAGILISIGMGLGSPS